jgi:hypothetical protein
VQELRAGRDDAVLGRGGLLTPPRTVVPPARPIRFVQRRSDRMVRSGSSDARAEASNVTVQSCAPEDDRDMSNLPIADYALLSDCRSAALVHRHGSIDWLCFPRFDGPSVFGRLLGRAAGHWSISATGDATVTRRYVPETLVLETTYRTTTGTAKVLDAMAVGRNERGHELGAGAPSVLMREIIGVDGEVAFDLEYAPRPEYGLVFPLLEPVEGGVRARGGPDAGALRARGRQRSLALRRGSR